MSLKTGLKALREGRVASLIVAGGQGTRLKIEGPKGLYPITPVRKKTLFQLFCEKIKAAEELAERELPFTIMTSPINDKETKEYFTKNHNFGVNPLFFSQEMLPFLDEKKNPLKISGPDGNGVSLFHFYKSGIWEKFKKQGVNTLLFIIIDNPLADPFDLDLISHHIEEKNDVTIKCIKKQDPHESVGSIVEIDEKIRIIEYTEMDSNESQNYPLANISLFAFSMDFIQEAAKRVDELPYHTQKKELPNGQSIWKREKFIFDNLNFAKKIGKRVYLREDVFSPLKNSTGNNSPDEVKRAIQQKDCKVFETITGVKPDRTHFELDQAFYYPTTTLLNRWKGRPLPKEEYIKP
ncbi:UTP--glucose-1-phosphate uridylyltransferase [Chlamydiales bacterium]|nr:UTP--glucose-1-phosphate uridylyltransferase [Chlamydiales bacterium]